MISEAEYEVQRFALSACDLFDSKSFEAFLKNEIHLGPPRRKQLVEEIQKILLDKLASSV